MSTSAYRTVIGCNWNQYKTNSTDPDRYLILDTQEPKTVNVPATIASHPLQDGDTMSDHMYRDPITINLSGSFSLNGKNWDDDSYNFVQVGDRLTNIQEVFETICREGILCTITTINIISDGDGIEIKNFDKNRFKVRKNMALKGIQWTEQQNSIKFTFNFQEVIMVETQGYEDLSEEEKSKYALPSVTSPKGSSLGSALIESGNVNKIVINNLYENGYMTPEFLEKVANDPAPKLAAIAVGVIAALVVKTALAAGTSALVGASIGSAVATAAGVTAAKVGIAAVAGKAALAALWPVGTIIIGAAAVGAGIYLGIHYAIKRKEKKQAAEKRKKVFDLINDSPEQGEEKLQNLLDKIEANVNNLKTNLTIYSINGNYEQQVVINIAGDYYIINFTKYYTTGQDYEWRASVEDGEGNIIKGLKNVWSPVSDIGSLDRNLNLWFLDDTKEYEVYLVNPSLSSEINPNQEELNNAKKQLEGYSIWVSHGPVQNDIKKIYQAIDAVIIAEGYD